MEGRQIWTAAVYIIGVALVCGTAGLTVSLAVDCWRRRLGKPPLARTLRLFKGAALCAVATAVLAVFAFIAIMANAHSSSGFGG